MQGTQNRRNYCLVQCPFREGGNKNHKRKEKKLPLDNFECLNDHVNDYPAESLGISTDELSLRGRRPSWLKSDDICTIRQKNCSFIQRNIFYSLKIRGHAALCFITFQDFGGILTDNVHAYRRIYVIYG